MKLRSVGDLVKEGRGFKIRGLKRKTTNKVETYIKKKHIQ